MYVCMYVLYVCVALVAHYVSSCGVFLSPYLKDPLKTLPIYVCARTKKGATALQMTQVVLTKGFRV